ncbi:nodulin-26-like [Glycine soja]|uniref:nodulin-26-like n=1 Tax=Glycine soja TaxID=3848 RepID=UPI00103FDE18|nr:nodulin-26-like [Glycine soja]
MSDSLSVNVDSSIKSEFSTDEGHKTIHETKHFPSNIQKAIAEVVSTYILIFAGCGAALVNEKLPLTIVGIAIVSGLALTVATYSIGHVFGGHFNPVVPIALVAVRKVQFKLVPIYVLCQMMGATLVPLTLKVLHHDKVDVGVTVTKYLSSTSHLEAIVWEFITASILMLTICGVATDHRGSKDLTGVAIGISVLINVIIAGPITGASMNPARSLGPAIVSGDYKNIWVYIVSPILGAVSASTLYKFLEVTQPVKPKSCDCNICSHNHLPL